jgi:hypothetical protein
MHYFDETARTLGRVEPGASGFAAYMARLGRGQGDDTEAIRAADGWIVRQSTWRLMEEREHLHPVVFTAWSELWTGAALAHDRYLRIELVKRRDAGDACWEWRIR